MLLGLARAPAACFTPALRRSPMAPAAASSSGPPRPAGRRGGSGGSSGGGRGGRGPGRGPPKGRNECPPGTAADRQAAFPGPFPSDPLTAIVGGGMSGLVCALELARAGLRSVVFDTGEHGVGGRLGTRATADGSLKGAPPGSQLLFDHAAQYFTASDPAFMALVAEWQVARVVEEWQGPVGALRAGVFTPDPSRSAEPRYVVKGGMRRLAEHLAGQASQALRDSSGGGGGGGGGVDIKSLVEVRRPQWVSEARATADGWQLVGRGREQGVFDAVVIAHNGKCANRLAAPMGVAGVYGQLRRLKLSANWVLMVAFAQPVAAPGALEGAVVQGCEVLSWAANNSAKLRLGGPAECWTLISSQAYGKANKVPQENVPAEVAERVAAEMLAAFERALGLPQGGLPPVLFAKTQLWGAALPLNTPRVPCIWDPVGRAGVCGDWVIEGGSMQAAALSGQAVAQRIAASRGRAPTDLADLGMGLTTPFKLVAGEEFGQFPSAGGQPPRQQAQQQQQPKPKPKQQPRQQQPKQLQAQQQPPKQPARKAGAEAQLVDRPVRPGGG